MKDDGVLLSCFIFKIQVLCILAQQNFFSSNHIFHQEMTKLHKRMLIYRYILGEQGATVSFIGNVIHVLEQEEYKNTNYHNISNQKSLLISN